MTKLYQIYKNGTYWGQKDFTSQDDATQWCKEQTGGLYTWLPVYG